MLSFRFVILAVGVVADLGLWPGPMQSLLNSLGGEAIGPLLLGSSTPCETVHAAMLEVVTAGHQQSADLTAGLVGRVHSLVERLEAPDHPDNVVSPYIELFAEPARAVQLALDAAQLLSLTVMAQKRCFTSTGRLALSRALQPLQQALKQQLSTMWWMFDISQYSNTNSPPKHLEAIFKAVRFSEGVFEQLTADLPSALAQDVHFWGHAEHGMFMNTTVIYRRLFPEAALVDKGILRFLLGILPRGGTIADFGALDGQYARWLNDTGWVTAYAFDGVEGVTELTEGSVSQANLAKELQIDWLTEPFDWVMCLEVAEHIPIANEAAFLDNLNRHAKSGLVISWAPPWVEGEGHVNCLEPEDSRRRIESLGFLQDEAATAAIRQASEISWIRESVAVYRRSSF